MVLWSFEGIETIFIDNFHLCTNYQLSQHMWMRCQVNKSTFNSVFNVFIVSWISLQQMALLKVQMRSFTYLNNFCDLNCLQTTEKSGLMCFCLYELQETDRNPCALSHGRGTCLDFDMQSVQNSVSNLTKKTIQTTLKCFKIDRIFVFRWWNLHNYWIDRREVHI